MKNNLDVAFMNMKYFDIETWNPTNSLEMLIIGVQKLLNKYFELEIKNETQEYSEIINIINILVKNNNITIKKYYNFDIDHIEISNTIEKNKSNCWAKGVGYGYKNNKSSKWNINEYIEVKNLKSRNNIENLEKLEKIIKKQLSRYTSNEESSIFYDNLQKSNFLKLISHFTGQINLIEIQNNKLVYEHLINIINLIDFKNLSNNEDISDISTSFSNISKDLKVYMKLQNENSLLIKKIVDLNNYFKSFMEIDNINENKSIKELYLNKTKEYQLAELDCEYTYFYKDKKKNVIQLKVVGQELVEKLHHILIHCQLIMTLVS